MSIVFCIFRQHDVPRCLAIPLQSRVLTVATRAVGTIVSYLYSNKCQYDRPNLSCAVYKPSLYLSAKLLPGNHGGTPSNRAKMPATMICSRVPYHAIVSSNSCGMSLYSLIPILGYRKRGNAGRIQSNTACSAVCSSSGLSPFSKGMWQYVYHLLALWRPGIVFYMNFQ